MSQPAGLWAKCGAGWTGDCSSHKLCRAGQPTMYDLMRVRPKWVGPARIAIPNLGYTSQSNLANFACSVSQLLQHPFLLQTLESYSVNVFLLPLRSMRCDFVSVDSSCSHYHLQVCVSKSSFDTSLLVSKILMFLRKFLSYFFLLILIYLFIINKLLINWF